MVKRMKNKEKGYGAGMHQANRDITRETKTKEAEQESTLRKRDAEKGQDKINKIIGELENEVECFCSTIGKAYI